MSDFVKPQRQQPTRLRRPWDSPGKNTGVGCHFLLQCMKVKSESEVAQSCPTPSDPMDCSLSGSSVHGIFQARVLEWGANTNTHATVSGVTFATLPSDCNILLKKHKSYPLISCSLFFKCYIEMNPFLIILLGILSPAIDMPSSLSWLIFLPSTFYHLTY